MKQLCYLLKFFGFLLPLLSFGSILFRGRNESWDGYFSGRLSAYKLGLTAMTLLFCVSGFVCANEVYLSFNQSFNYVMITIGGLIENTGYWVDQCNTTITNIVIEYNVPFTGLGSVTQTSGSWFFNATPGVGLWTVPLLASGNAFRLEINVVDAAPGVFFNISQLMTSSDINSFLGNLILTKDDVATSCFSVPIEWYTSNENTVEVLAPFFYGTGIFWFNNNQPLGSTSTEVTENDYNSLTIRGFGSYTFTTTITNCSGSCCYPIILIQGIVLDLTFTKNLKITTRVAGGLITDTLNTIDQGRLATTDLQLSNQLKNNGSVTSTIFLLLNELTEGLIKKEGTIGLLIERTNQKNVIPMLTVGARKTYKTKLNKAGKLNKVSADQGNSIKSNNIDDFAVDFTTCRQTGRAMAFKGDTIIQSNGIFKIKFNALFKYFATPASFSLVGNRGGNLNSLLATNNSFRRTHDTTLILPKSMLAARKQNTIMFTCSLVTGANEEFGNEAIANGTGAHTNGTASTMIDASNTCINSNISGSRPTQIILGRQKEGSEIKILVGLVISSINKAKMEEGTCNTVYQAIVNNCGNLVPAKMVICDTLSNAFSSPKDVKVVSSTNTRLSGGKHYLNFITAKKILYKWGGDKTFSIY
jgi:hypothetical protein